MATTIMNGTSVKYDERFESLSWELFVEIAIKMVDRFSTTPSGLGAVYIGNTLNNFIRDLNPIETLHTFLKDG